MKRARARFGARAHGFPGGDLLSRALAQYHRRGGLNCRVRDGNGCFPAAVTTRKFGDSFRNRGRRNQGRWTSSVRRARPVFTHSSCRARRARANGRMDGQADRLISTGPLSTSPCLHARPINVVVFDEPQGSPVSGLASRLDAFSAYPYRTWLPGNAPSGTTRTPEVRPSQSSRTKERLLQGSCTHRR